MTAYAVPREGRHRRSGYVLPEPPDDAEKSSYAWRSLPLLATALSISALCLIAAQVWFELRYAHVLPFAVAVRGRGARSPQRTPHHPNSSHCRGLVQ